MHTNKHMSTIARALSYAHLSNYHDDRGNTEDARSFARRSANAMRSVVQATHRSSHD